MFLFGGWLNGFLGVAMRHWSGSLACGTIGAACRARRLLGHVAACNLTPARACYLYVVTGHEVLTRSKANCTRQNTTFCTSKRQLEMKTRACEKACTWPAAAKPTYTGPNIHIKRAEQHTVAYTTKELGLHVACNRETNVHALLCFGLSLDGACKCTKKHI